MRGANITKTNRARRLRQDSTNAELRLWNRLRSRAICGQKFVRQEPVGQYVVDFICRERRLIVEIDGGQHNAEYDRARDTSLHECNYHVLHFWNNDVMKNIDGVLETIAAAHSVEAPPRPDCADARSDLSPQAGRGHRVARSAK